MVRLGRYQQLVVREQVPHGFLLGAPGDRVLLPNAQALPSAEVGAEVRVFVYHQLGEVLQASMKPPAAAPGEFAHLRCVSVSEHGAFLDWGLPKDLFVPFALQHQRMVAGQRYVVHVGWDSRGERIVGSSKLAPHFDYDTTEVRCGDAVDLLVFGVSDLGAQVVVDQSYAGMIFTDATFRPLRVGELLQGYVARVRDDQRLDITLSPPNARGNQQRDQAQQVLLAALAEADGFLPIHDKSSPAAIEQALGMSKKVFKRAVGELYKARKLQLEADGLRLLADAD